VGIVGRFGSCVHERTVLRHPILRFTDAFRPTDEVAARIAVTFSTEPVAAGSFHAVRTLDHDGNETETHPSESSRLRRTGSVSFFVRQRVRCDLDIDVHYPTVCEPVPRHGG
jgi:imidazoleglycerol phosphate dehydratase HisB